MYCISGDYPYVSYNGMYNNPSHIRWGSAGSPLSHPLRPQYSDGTKSAIFPYRASARNISLSLFREGRPVPLSKRFTAILPYFMEFLHHDIFKLPAACPPESLDIGISPDDPVYGNNTRGGMPLDRVQYIHESGLWADLPRQQINSVTSWIDASHVYGISKGWADIIRSGNGGRLKSADDKTKSQLPKNEKSKNTSFPPTNRWGVPLSSNLKPHNCLYPDINHQYLFGDGRSNGNPGLLSFHWLMYSEHNNIARELNDSWVGMNDKWLFDKSRYLTIAKFQKVTFDALETLVGPGKIPPYQHYRPSHNPGISFLYAGAVQFFFLTMIPDMIYTMPASSCTLHVPHMRLCNTMWDAQEALKGLGPETVLRGLAHQRAGAIDDHFVKDIRSHYYGPRHWTRRDGVAIAIQRGRDLGVPPLNTVLQYYSLPPMSWDDWNQELNGHPEKMLSLMKLYKYNVNQVELFVGGMLLSTSKGEMAEVFKRILVQQFVSLRDGDRFWWQNPYNGLGCSKVEVNEINRTTLQDILVRNSVNVTGNVFSAKYRDWDCNLDSNSFNISDCEGGMMFHFNYNTTPYAIPLTIPLFLLFAVVLALIVNRIMWYKLRKQATKNTEGNACEWGRIKGLQSRTGDRLVNVTLDSSSQTLVCKSREQQRVVHWKKLSHVQVISCTDSKVLLLISIPKEHDILLKFSSVDLRFQFMDDLTRFSDACNVTTELKQLKKKEIMQIAKTEAHRQELVDAFLSSVFSDMMEHDEEEEETVGDVARKDCAAVKESAKEEWPNKGVDGENRGDISDTGEVVVEVAMSPHKRDNSIVKVAEIGVLECELTRSEFAAALGLRSDQEFVEKVFPLVDKDNNGTVSYREFLNFMVVYSSGSFSNKLSLIFNMYDHDKSGSLDVSEIKVMIRSMLEMVSASIGPAELDQLLTSLFKLANLQVKTELTFEEFKTVMSRYESDIDRARLEVQSGDVTLKITTKGKSFTARPHENRYLVIKRHIENNRLQLFYSTMYVLAALLLFTERFITYSRYKFHTGYPQLLGYSLSFTRGSAAVLMFNFPIFLLLMCKNTLTHIRRTFLKRLIPIDSNRTAHIVLGYVTLLFIIIHVVGHAYNFYMISTLSPDHLGCLMPKTWLSGTSQATVTGLIFGTITGITGILLVLCLVTMFIFSTEYSRNHLYRYFWWTHHLYPVVLLLIVLHGTARLLQEPSFHYYLLGPALLFTFDKMMSVSRNKREIPLLQANILPSEVTNLVFKRPLDFHYMAGQYVKIALVNSGTGRDEYHPFTLTSAPHENFLSVHIRTCKGWTKVLRNLVISNQKRPENNPNLYVDGPFGEAHQDYSSYEVVILVGGGIGVTPFASILKDLIHKATSLRSNLTKVKKVYFLWSTRTQKQFEWLNDIIQRCEEEDKMEVLDTHIFITRFYEKSDLRTTMLYICERQFQRISNRSLFTGLKAVTHFGRPNFESIFEHIRMSHADVRKFGVFVCGPPAMSDSVNLACSKVTGKQIFVAYTETF